MRINLNSPKRIAYHVSPITYLWFNGGESTQNRFLVDWSSLFPFFALLSIDCGVGGKVDHYRCNTIMKNYYKQRRCSACWGTYKVNNDKILWSCDSKITPSDCQCTNYLSTPYKLGCGMTIIYGMVKIKFLYYWVSLEINQYL